MPWGWQYGGWAMVLLTFIFWILMILGVVYVARNAVAWGREPRTEPPFESALDVLQKRYARGEITREQYQQMRDDLGPSR